MQAGKNKEQRRLEDGLGGPPQIGVESQRVGNPDVIPLSKGRESQLS